MIVVSIKYAGFIMGAHNHGDGGIMAVTAVIRRRRVAHAAVLVTLGIFGAGLFFGDRCAVALAHPKCKLAGLGALFLTVEVAFFSSNVGKIAHGPWLSLGAGVVISAAMITWRKGQQIVTENRTARDEPLEQPLESLRTREPPTRRVPGTAVFLNSSEETTPPGATRRGRAQPHPPREGRDRLARHG